MSLKKKSREKMEELAESYPAYYEMRYMNSDTPRQSGIHYLTHGYKAGYRAALKQDPIVLELVEALEFYEKMKHLDGDWDSVSGEPPNILCLAETDEWHWVESGEVAKQALAAYKEATESKDD